MKPARQPEALLFPVDRKRLGSDFNGKCRGRADDFATHKTTNHQSSRRIADLGEQYARRKSPRFNFRIRSLCKCVVGRQVGMARLAPTARTEMQEKTGDALGAPACLAKQE